MIYLHWGLYSKFARVSLYIERDWVLKNGYLCVCLLLFVGFVLVYVGFGRPCLV